MNEMTSTIDTKSSVEMIFSERGKFVIIGLTGATGSGCSTVASILCQEFAGIDPPKPDTFDYKGDEDRKYEILHDYAKANWKSFHKINMTSVISSFLIRGTDGEIKDLLAVCGLTAQESVDFVEKQYLTDPDIAQYRNMSDKVETNFTHDRETQPPDLYTGDDSFNFYFDHLPKFTQILKDKLKIYARNLFTRLYQTVGNNIRASGTAFQTHGDAKNMFALAEIANRMVKILRRRAKEKPCRIVIDALRNPYEILFFRYRYASFYAMAISTSENDRKGRLSRTLGMDDSQIDALDKQEGRRKLKNGEKFVSQNVPRCLEISDIYISNLDEAATKDKLKRQIIRYVTLMIHPGLVTPSLQERCMQVAFQARVNSGCISRQVGAVVTDSDFSIKAVGWNNTPQGQTPCLLRKMDNLFDRKDEQSFSEYERTTGKFQNQLKQFYDLRMISPDALNGRHLPYCFKDQYNLLEEKDNQVHTRALHAEENAMLQIAKYGGEGLKGGALFSTASPCELCSKKAYQIGISNIYYIDPYPGIAREHVLNIGRNIPELHLFEGAIGRGYQQLFENLMPFKDELGHLLGFAELEKRIQIEKAPETQTEETLRRENEDLRKQIELLKAEKENSISAQAQELPKSDVKS